MPLLSLRPSDAQAGGFLDDVDVTLKEVRFTVWDYNGKANPSVALKVTMEEADGITHEQYYSAGDPSKYQPTLEGRSIEALGSSTGFNQNTNVIAFLTSLVNAGFPEDRLGEDVSVFDGTLVHVNQVAQPKRPGLQRVEPQQPKTYLLVTRILRLPWEAPAKAPAKGAPKPVTQPTLKAVTPANAVPHQVAHPTPSPAPDPAAAPAEDVVQKARDTVVAILAEKGGALPKAKLPTEAFRALTNDPDRNAVVMVIYQESFLQNAKAEGVFAYDGTTVTLG